MVEAPLCLSISRTTQVITLIGSKGPLYRLSRVSLFGIVTMVVARYLFLGAWTLRVRSKDESWSQAFSQGVTAGTVQVFMLFR